MRLGYSTKSLVHVDPWQAIAWLADVGFQSVQLALHPLLLHPGSSQLEQQRERFRVLLRDLPITVVLDATVPFVVDPLQPDLPGLVCSETQRRTRIDYLQSVIQSAAIVGADCVIFTSGPAAADQDAESQLEGLAAALTDLVRFAAQHQVRLALQPEKGMFVDTAAGFERLLQWVEQPLALSLNVGNSFIQGEMPLARYIDRFQHQLANVVLQDRLSGDPRPRWTGEGEMHFPPIIDALAHVGYDGAVHVEVAPLPRDELLAARRAFDVLSPLWKKT